MRFVLAVALAAAAAASTYQNPVLKMDFPDPTVIRGGDGAFYAYATMGNGHRLQVASSPDLVSWSYHGEVLDVPSWVGANTWAPDVSLHDGTYWMYFAATDAAANVMCIAVATSTNPLGPFKDALGKPLVCSPASNPFGAIDPKSWDDPATGKTYLFMGSDFVPLTVQELDSSRIAFAAGSTPTVVITPSSSPYESLVEGSWLYPGPQGLYLYYSGNACCGAGANYAVMVARSDNATGPFVKLGTASGTGSSVILSLSPSFVAPGHNSIVTDDAGNDWMFYHAYANGTQTFGPRMLMMDKIVYREVAGAMWPYVGQPSDTLVPGPVVTAPAAPTITTIPASSASVKWVGRTQTVQSSVVFDWEGVSATVTVSGASFLAVNISDLCGGTSVGGGSRWLVTMNTSNPASAPPNHRINTFYTGRLTQWYYLFNNPGEACDPACTMTGPITFTLTRLTESRLSGCTATAGLAVNAFITDGVFQAPPPPSTRRLEFVGDSITAGDLNDNGGVTVCANSAWDDDITLSSGAQLCLPSALDADCMFTAWGGIQLGVPPTWGMSDLYPFTFSSQGTNAYTPWAFSQFPVDAVVINLGTNDRPAPPALTWQAAYVQFVQTVAKGYYPSKPSALAVFLAYGPMTTEYQPFVVNITDTLVAGGYNAHVLDLTLPHPMTGCYGHPSAADNVEIAAKALPQITAVLGW